MNSTGEETAVDFDFEREGHELVVCLRPCAVEQKAVDVVGARHVRFREDIPTTVASSAVTASLFRLLTKCERMGMELDLTHMPSSLKQLWQLYASGRGSEQSREAVARPAGIFSRLGNWGKGVYGEFLEISEFTGNWMLGLVRLFRGKCPFSIDQFWGILKTVTTDALPIVSLISFLIGLIISFLGAVVLMRFGAEFAVSYLVGYGMFREMGAVMTGIIIAGRTGASFAAQIGSMKVNEELDALRTFGINPIDFVVLPRMLSLALAMPLLVLYANIVGIIGGYLVAVGMMGVPGPLFFTEMQSILGLGDFFLGIFKGAVFGVLVGMSGCLRGLQSGSSATGVGKATTEAVVLGITLIIMANAFIDWAAATFGI